MKTLHCVSKWMFSIFTVNIYQWMFKIHQDLRLSEIEILCVVNINKSDLGGAL